MGRRDLPNRVCSFVELVAAGSTELYNVFSLQHELGIFLRGRLPSYQVQFERNVSFFFPMKAAFTKWEIDISVFSPDRRDLKFAIELKYPCNGQYPEQMFSFCKDIAFAEELHRAGFSTTALVIFADDPLFYRGATGGIYGVFRGGQPLSGRIQKPTRPHNDEVMLLGTYLVQWKPLSGTLKFTIIEVG
jgi:hypothetical protein